MPINFFSNGVEFTLPRKLTIKRWLKTVILEHEKRDKNISIIFCSDSEILKINKEYLNHNYFTDIITFPLSEGKLISADIYISIDTVNQNSSFYNVPFNDELNRVMVHGILHLLGYNDTSEPEQLQMRKAEDYWLSRLSDS